MSRPFLTRRAYDKLAVCRFANCFRRRILLEIAGERVDEFEKLHICAYKQLSARKGILTDYFRARWEMVKTILNIVEDEEVLGRMDKVVRSHEDTATCEIFRHTIDELLDIAKDLPYAASAVPLLTYGKILAERRKDEGLFEVKAGYFI
jgi:hypothetical protein